MTNLLQSKFDLPTLTVGALIRHQAEGFSEKQFLVFPETGETLSYSELHQLTQKTAQLLESLSVQKNDKVGLLLPNIPGFIAAYWGCMTLGAVACPINTLLKGAEIEYILNHCEAKILFTTAEFAAELNSILDSLHLLTHVILIADSTPATAEISGKTVITFESALHDLNSNNEPAEHSVSANDEAMIIYTSGTTGKPKGVILTHHNLIMDAHYIAGWFNLLPETVMMNILPLFHVNGEVVTLMTPLYAGASVVLNRKFSAATFWQYIETYRVNVFSTVPTILSILLSHQPEQAFDRASLKFGICGAAPLPVEVHQRFEATFDIPVYEGYGLSETTCYSTFNPPSLEKRKIGTIGVAIGNEVAIWDENNQPIPDGEGGEIVVRGENVMPGYFKNPEATEKAFAGGWFHTGDWGSRDEDGFFRILDRVKDMIIRGGENIYPREVDELLYSHPKISAAATIGIPDQKYGEEVKSFVVIEPGESLTEEEVLTFCRERMAAYKCPKSVAFIDEIPKGPTGKLLRKALRELESGSESL